MNCETVDTLAAAYAIGAVEPDEERAFSTHLADCDQPHAEARGLIEAGALLDRSVEPVAPSAGLRDRVLATVTATPQDHRQPEPRPSAVPQVAPMEVPWWRRAAAPMAIAAAALAVAIGIGVWNVALRQEVAERDRAIAAIASADAVHQVSGSAGSGLLVETAGEATFIADNLADLAPGELYELWLIGPDGTPVAVGTLEDSAGLALVTLEEEIGASTTFAVTIETERVEAPTSEPVLVASLEG